MKQRLVDANKITFFDCLAKTGNSICCHAKGIISKEGIDAQPTVNAIPQIWIEEYTSRDITADEYWAVVKMLKTWKEENEDN